MGQAHSLKVFSFAIAQEAPVVRVSVRGPIVAIEVQRAGIVTIVSIAQQDSAAKAGTERSTYSLL